ncbi:MAG: hypothetical protein HY896_08165 [Deltaproteobacteria bacterium]|nr:hypothetical protein [Deltaproteobacteria bacterium]
MTVFAGGKWFCVLVLTGALANQYMTTGEPTPVLPPVPPPAGRPINYECPKGKYLDCMPPLQGEKRNQCSPEYLDWIKNHCPDVRVVY